MSIGGKLQGSDPGGLELRYEITTEPIKGSVELQEDGSFVYTPAEGKKGRDYFGFTVTNSDGISSQEATVIIRIQKQKTTVSYSDMRGSGSEYAAVLLAEKGIYTGACTGGTYLFVPEEEVSRAEFLAMCMQLGDEKLISGVMTTGFADDETIPVWAKTYVSTALMQGYINGYSENGRAVFRAQNGVTLSEASVMLSEVLGLSNVVSVSQYDEETVPVWAASQTASLASRGLIELTMDSSKVLTRTECADILARAIEYLSE